VLHSANVDLSERCTDTTDHAAASTVITSASAGPGVIAETLTCCHTIDSAPTAVAATGVISGQDTIDLLHYPIGGSIMILTPRPRTAL
jgi:hypothetical protein